LTLWRTLNEANCVFTPLVYPFALVKPVARQPKLRKKKIGKSVYWFTKAGGDTYFGNVSDLPYSEARKLFNKHVASVMDAQEDRKVRELSAAELMETFLDWIEKHRSERTYSTRRTYCNRFGNFKVKGVKMGDLPALKVRASDLESWLGGLEVEGLAPQTRRHAQTSIKHCWNWATKHCPEGSNTPYFPPTFRTFASVEQVFVPRKALTEDDLITDAEIKALFTAAELDLDMFHRFAPKTARTPQQNPYRSFADMLRCYHATGARTDELGQCRKQDVLFNTKQVVLGKHKRSKKERTPTLRTITLNDEALAIFSRYCAGKDKPDYVFLNSDGKPCKRKSLAQRFNRVKEVAAEKGIGKVRAEITIYAFRHLWISESLMAGNDLATVAKMAGTSIAMIERVYGHFRNQHLHDAQFRLDEHRRQRSASRPDGGV
jgi:integrase